MNSRTWTAVIICTGIWLVYVQWFAPVAPKPRPATTTAQQNSEGVVPPELHSATAASNPLFAEGLTPEKNIHLIHSRYEMDFSLAGGKPAEVRLNQYRKTIEKNAPPVSPLSPEENPYSLATLFTESDLRGFSRGEYKGTEGGEAVTFFRQENGIAVIKRFAAQENSYLTDLDITIDFEKYSKGSLKSNWGNMLIPIGANSIDFEASTPLKSWEIVYFQNDSRTRKTADNLKEEPEVVQGNTSWLAFGNRYFTTAVVNKSAINPDVIMQSSKEFKGAYLRFPVVLKAGEKKVTYSFKIYSGPKEYSELAKEGNLTQIIDHGMFAVFALPLLRVLKFFYSVIPNYGVAIILLTIAVRILFFPLQAKSVRSMKEMQKLQPQIAALKEKYKDDMQRYNQEQMALFKSHKVNPMGGCLPMLVQLPVMFALYSVIGNSIELFHAPFFGWIHDLSAKDPFFIYPVLMGVSMFIQQKMTPSPGMDPAQQKIMMIMPVMFSFMMIGLPAGLTMYIFVSTILGIAQQRLTSDKAKKSPSFAVATSK